MLSGPEEQADVLIAFWDGINLHFQNSEENPFEDTKGFSIQKELVQQCFMRCYCLSKSI